MTERASQVNRMCLMDQLLDALGMQVSMSRRGNYYDNAPMESFWGSLKNELLYQRRFATRAQARAAITEWIEVFYNRQRLHSALGYQSPVAFRQGGSVRNSVCGA